MERNLGKIRKKKRKAIVGLVIAAVLLILIVPMLISKPTIDEDLLAISSAGQLSADDSFLGTMNYINSFRQRFDFVSQLSTRAVLYDKTFVAPDIYPKPKNYNVVMGVNCNVGEAIRFWICSDKNDKASCDTDMFNNLWFVETTNNYPNSKNFDIDDLELYYTYACYDPLGDIESEDLGFEHSVLLNGKCISQKEANGRGEDFGTEKFCLEALEQEILEEQETQKEEDLQLERDRIACLSTEGDWDGSDCTYPQEDDTQLKNICESQGKIWSGTQCLTPSLKCPTGQVVIDGKCVSTSTTTSTSGTTGDTTTSDSGDTTTSTTGDATVDESKVCRDYEELVQDIRCEFSLKNFVSDEGFADYYEDEPLNVVLVGIIVVVLVIVLILQYTGSRGRKK